MRTSITAADIERIVGELDDSVSALGSREDLLDWGETEGIEREAVNLVVEQTLALFARDIVTGANPVILVQCLAFMCFSIGWASGREYERRDE